MRVILYKNHQARYTQSAPFCGQNHLKVRCEAELDYAAEALLVLLRATRMFSQRATHNVPRHGFDTKSVMLLQWLRRHRMLPPVYVQSEA